MRNNDVEYSFLNFPNLTNIKIKGKKIKLVYSYCFSREELITLAPPKNSIIFNLFNFNGGCVSDEAYILAKQMNVKLFLHEDFINLSVRNKIEIESILRKISHFLITLKRYMLVQPYTKKVQMI